jgi:hypothetical protein
LAEWSWRDAGIERSIAPRGNSMANFILIRHKVRDFNEWKPGFEGHASKRAEAGLSVKYVLRSADDQNEVVVLVEAADLNRAKAFVGSPELREAMQSLGVVRQDLTAALLVLLPRSTRARIVPPHLR